MSKARARGVGNFGCDSCGCRPETQTITVGAEQLIVYNFEAQKRIDCSTTELSISLVKKSIK